MKSNKASAFTAGGRLESGKYKSILILQLILYSCAFVALTVATGVYLWDKEVDNKCAHCNSDGCNIFRDDVINVHDRFSDILKIYFAVFIANSVRCILVLLAVLTNNKKLVMLDGICCFNDCLAFAALIIIHVYRFQYSGKWCSGDVAMDKGNLSYDDMTKVADSESGKFYLIHRGRLLLGIVIWIWVGGFSLGCISVVHAILIIKS
ncbi:UNKNOWN [Stylonychia lemnae]|uniref:Uncharacterized protein n=1 Tax=Stylonychia lemnae TaxID=5949 RepID=A0A078B5I0_STYLE|nr:UNKNOWN [Stylonychia lemnae]|eukprot:CDW88557.1 UNKNOWN [Stylonychia lemnae]